MKRIMALVFLLTLALVSAGCGSANVFEIRITVPAGSTEAFVYSDEEFCPVDDTIILSAGDGLPDTEILLKEIEGTNEKEYTPTYLTPGMPVKMAVEKDAWYKVGVSMQNPSDEDIHLTVEIKMVKTVRIE